MLAQRVYDSYWRARGEPSTLWENLSPASQAPWYAVVAEIYDLAMKSAYAEVTSATAQQCARIARHAGATGAADDMLARYAPPSAV